MDDDYLEAYDETYIEIALERELRSQSGDAFQDFFSKVMERRHKDFVKIQAHGPKGDEGVDGLFLADGKTIYQCYGAKNGHVIDSTYVCNKIRKDFDTIRVKHPKTKKWYFTHNLVGGVIMDVSNTVEEMREIGSKSGMDVAFFGPKLFEDEVKQLSKHDIRRLLGIDVHQSNKLERLPLALNEIIKGIMEIAGQGVVASGPPKEVPLEKFDYNSIPPLWRRCLTLALADAPIAWDCIGRFGDATAAETVPAYFKERYAELKLSYTSSERILEELQKMMVGKIRTLESNMIRDFAGHVMLATMFESCQIFEDKEKITSGTDQ